MKKLKTLQRYLLQYNKLAIAFSGGVDSTFLLQVAVNVLGCNNVHAYTVNNLLVPAGELKRARRFTKKNKIVHSLVDLPVLDMTSFVKNGKNRCYVCKKHIFTRLRKTAEKDGYPLLCDGANADDLTLFRPGNAAAKEIGIVRPLAECGFTKRDVRKGSFLLNLSTWDKPAQTCFATRFPYGWKLTESEVLNIAAVECYLERLGFRHFRVRRVESGVRIEVGPKDFPEICTEPVRKKIVTYCKRKGYVYISLDLEGYRSGSMDIA